MKKMFLSVLAVGLLLLLFMTVAGTPAVNDAEVSAAEDRDMPASVIDDISVPYDVTIYVEEEYPGHAIVQASKTYRQGQEVYRLRIDRDSKDYNSHYLYYSKKWKLLDHQKLNTAPPPPKKQPEPKDDDKEKDEENKKVDEQAAEPGRGGMPKPPTSDDDEPDDEPNGDDEDSENPDMHERIRRGWRNN